MSTATLRVTGPEQIAVPRTASVLSALITLTRRDGRPPTIDQLKIQAGIRSTKMLYRELDRLKVRRASNPHGWGTAKGAGSDRAASAGKGGETPTHAHGT